MPIGERSRAARNKFAIRSSCPNRRYYIPRVVNIAKLSKIEPRMMYSIDAIGNGIGGGTRLSQYVRVFGSKIYDLRDLLRDLSLFKFKGCNIRETLPHRWSPSYKRSVYFFHCGTA
jgi:hypothetical protein